MTFYNDSKTVTTSYEVIKALFFGCLYPMYHGMIIDAFLWGVFSIIAGAMTAGAGTVVAWVLYPIIVKNRIRNHYISRGYAEG